jgi:hypothetical protein
VQIILFIKSLAGNIACGGALRRALLHTMPLRLVAEVADETDTAVLPDDVAAEAIIGSQITSASLLR